MLITGALCRTGSALADVHPQLYTALADVHPQLYTGRCLLLCTNRGGHVELWAWPDVATLDILHTILPLNLLRGAI